MKARLSILVIGSLALAVSARAEIQTTGTPGSPSATTTTGGKQLPLPDPKFGGVIKEKATDSKPWWAPRAVPPKGAPNVLLIMTDDCGFGSPGTFGGVIPTPALDRVAKNGLRYSNFHSTSLCSPTRARFQHLLGQFVDARLAFFDARQNLLAVEEAIDRTEKLHDQMWGLVKTEALRDPPMRHAEGMMRLRRAGPGPAAPRNSPDQPRTPAPPEIRA